MAACLMSAIVVAPGPAEASWTSRAPAPTIAMPSSDTGTEAYDYTTEDAFPGFSFIDPTGMAVPPGETNRLFVLQRGGPILVVTNLADPGVESFMTVPRLESGGEKGVLGLAFHPGYATNGRFFVFFTGQDSSPGRSGLHDILAEYQVDPADPNSGLAGSETVLIKQYDQAGNHNGGDLHFGPDGYLYAALGDEGGANDSYNNSQRIDRDFFAGILRLDVDERPSSVAPTWHPANHGAVTNYSIPDDNPYVGATQFDGQAVNTNNLRAEFYAVGLRNPWRMGFDRVTGDLWAGDVGQGAREEINRITNGGNYGWSYWEGTLTGPDSTPRPQSDFAGPVLEYPHGGGAWAGYSVTGGRVYRGDRLPELVGQYLFADYVSGNLWSLDVYDTGTNWQRVAVDGGIAGFGEDPRNGDLLLADLGENRIKRLVRQETGTTNSLPLTLEDTGLFSDPETLNPAAGVLPYEVNVPFWSDYAGKRRWFALPETNQAFGYAEWDPWQLPAGAVWVKHFELALTNGQPDSIRRLETRVLVNGSNGLYGATYRWGSSETNAVLVPSGGLDEDIRVVRNGGVVTQRWRYPARQECLTCHTPAAGDVLGFRTPQLNREAWLGSDWTNQLHRLEALGYLAPAPDTRHALPRFVAATNSDAALVDRARTYIDVNCSQCHRPGGTAPGQFDARRQTPLSMAGLLNGSLNDNRGDSANRVLRPGDADHSMLLSRIETNGPGRMPPLASTVIDTQAVALVTAWIQELATYETFAAWQTNEFGSSTLPAAAGDADPDTDGLNNRGEWLAGTNPQDGNDAYGTEIALRDNTLSLGFLRPANRRAWLETTTNLSAGSQWRRVDRPGNTLAVSASNAMEQIDLPPDHDGPFFRVRLAEP